MSIFERVKAQLLTEMNDIEEMFKNSDERKPGNCLETSEVVVRYQLNGQDRFFVLDHWSIYELLRKRAATLRRELVSNG